MPSTPDRVLNEILCSFSEIFWIFSIYIRMYSIFLIAVYRYLAVFKLIWYKKVNSSNFILLTPVFFIWFMSILLPIITKYLFNTKPHPVFCLDGNTMVFVDLIMYFIVNYSLMVFIPLVLVIMIYYKIILKLRQLGKKVIKAKFNAKVSPSPIEIASLSSSNSKATIISKIPGRKAKNLNLLKQKNLRINLF